jgi:hypothetical protein
MWMKNHPHKFDMKVTATLQKSALSADRAITGN